MNKTIRDGLKNRPWLEPFIEAGDENLEPAETRWREAVDLAIRQLEEMGVEVFERMLTADGLETTALIVAEREPR